MKDIAYHSITFLEVKLAVIGHNSCCILSPVLQDDETVIEILNDVLVAGEGENAAH